MGSENSRNLVKHLIGMAWCHIENDFGGGTCAGLLELYDEYFNALDENKVNETEEGKWRLDLSKNNLYMELHRGLRIGQ